MLFLCFSSVSVFSADYYWVGGSGNWSDISHWAAISGGSVKYPTAPSSEDNVIFDENSFTGPNQTVTFTNRIVFCKSMDWSNVTNTPTLAGEKNVSVSVFGDFVLSPNMFISFAGEFTLSGEEGQKRVNLGGLTIDGVFTFAGESTWDIESDITIDSMLQVSEGNVNFNGFLIACRFFHINTDGEKNIDISNSDVLISGAYQDEYGYDGDGSISFYMQNIALNFVADNARIELSAPNATFHHYGSRPNVDLNDVEFSATTGRVFMTSAWFDETLSFRNLTFGASALIEGTISANTVTLAGGGRYRFGAERSYEFDEIVTIGDCAEGVIATSDNPGFPASFVVSTGTLNLDYITLRDIHGTGGATLHVDNGVDLGNNDGWNFTNSMANDFYWIGGSGTWNDPQHWSFSSGGPSSGCVPSGKDNAFFDVNSFSGPNQSVRLSSNASFIHDLTWSGVAGNPEFTGTLSQRMVVTGSLELDPVMEHNVAGFYDFESTETTNTIRMNGNIFNESITFSGVPGAWTFLNDVEVYRRVYFRSGLLRINGFQLTTTRLTSNTRLDRVLDISDSYILMRESQYLGPEWSVDLENYSVIADNSTIEFNANGIFAHDGNSGTPPPNYDVLRHSNSNAGVSSTNNSTTQDSPAVIINDLTFAGRGSFMGSNHLKILRMTDGFAYFFDASYDRKQVIDLLLTQGSCESGLTQLLGSEPGNMGKIELLSAVTLDRMHIQDIDVIQGSLINNNSLDGGNNLNMIFNEISSRTLYWVGNGGLWQDPAHWSLSSGGIGGECIPTLVDDVFFDANSFTVDDQEVVALPETFANCRDLSAQGIGEMAALTMDLVVINGSLRYDMTADIQIGEHIFVSGGPETIRLGGQQINDIRFRGSGGFTLLDEIDFNRWTHEAGTVNFGSNLLKGTSIYAFGGAEKTFNLESSKITLSEGGDAFNDRGSNITVLPGDSELTLTGNQVGIFSENELEFNRVVFSNTEGTGYFAARSIWDNTDLTGSLSASSVEFYGNGYTQGNLFADSLIGVAGKVYVFDSERTVSVSSFLQLRGNNCTPIEVRSLVNNVKATIEMPSSAEIVVDFVQMKDIIGAGGASFNAGSRSVDVGNSNIGWIFEDAPDFIESGFLGADRAICLNEPVELVAFSYSPNEQYLWSDGSSEPSLIIDEQGVFFVEVQFESNCVLRDTVTIINAEVFAAELPDFSPICESGTVELDAEVSYQDATYLWQDGTLTPTFETSVPGQYIVEVEALGCITKDSTIVSLVSGPGDFLPADTSICHGTEITLHSSVEGSSYAWADGSSNEELMINQEGLSWLDLTDNGCTFRDSIYVSLLAIPELELGVDTVICENGVLEFALDERYEYLWQDGSTSPNYSIMEAGDYMVTAGENGCLVVDSISVGLMPAPDLDLGDNKEVCASETVMLLAPDSYVNFTWDDGSEVSDREVFESGIYWLEVEEEGCTSRDSILVDFLALPMIDLGQDVIACEEELYIVKPVSVGFGDVTWQDGSMSDSYEVRRPGLITAEIFDGMCTNIDSLLVGYKDCTFFDIYIPNAFSPNGDGNNDLFGVFVPDQLIVTSYTMSIYDRWGNRVYASEDISGTWDGRSNSEELSNGVYVYFVAIDYEDENGPGSEELSGDIAIFR